MHKKNRRVKRTCECGKTFHPTIKFGNEDMCDACYNRHHEEFMDWLGSQPIERQRELLVELRQTCRALGVEIDNPTEEQEQAHTQPHRVTMLACQRCMSR